MAFCTNCGKKIKDGMKFCPDCGATVEEGPQSAKASPSSKSASHAAAGTAALGKGLPMPKRNYKAIGIAVLAVVAVVVLLLLLSRRKGGSEDSFLDQFQGYWDMETQVGGDATAYVERPRNIGITKNAIQLDELYTCPMSEAEYKDGALYFSAHWYKSIPCLGQEAGEQHYSLRLVYDRSSDLLTLEVEVPAGLSITPLFGDEYVTSGGWNAIGEYIRAD